MKKPKKKRNKKYIPKNRKPSKTQTLSHLNALLVAAVLADEVKTKKGDPHAD